jgi:hypothetical protein
MTRRVDTRHSCHCAGAMAFFTQNSPLDCFAPDEVAGVVLKGYEDGLAAVLRP